MKHKILLMLLLIGSVLLGQVPTIEDLPRPILKEWKKDVRETRQNARKADRQGYDIKPDPIETPIEIPAEYNDDPTVQEIISWQTEMQRLQALENRIVNECNFPIHFKTSDSGADQDHRDLQAGFVEEFDWTGEGNNPGTHGTHVQGIIHSYFYPLFENGVATWEDHKSLRASGSGSFAWAANMFFNNIEDVRERTANGQTVIWNCSWGGGTNIIESVETQMRKNVEAGAIIVAAFGNSGSQGGFPGISPQVFGITSLDESLTISSFSSRGPEVDGTAGGRNIYSTLPGNRYGLASGTSMASPAFAAIFVGYARAKWGPELLPDYDALTQYYKQIAVQVGNGDPELYSFGYPYIEAILNTRPGGNPPPDDEPEEPTPGPDDYYAAGIAENGFIIPWRFVGETNFRNLYVPAITFESLSKNGEEAAYEEAMTFIQSFFEGRALEVLPEMSWYSATKWTGRFINLVSSNEGLDLSVLELTGKDTNGLTYYANDFTWDQQALSELMLGVKLIDLE
ncbi:MAG: S8 family serine peptidase [Bacteroidota bacterium]